MYLDDKTMEYVERNTEILRYPKQPLSTFSTTTLNYYLLTEPVYKELKVSKEEETVIREGKITAERPKIITPSYILNFEGFDENGKKYAKMVLQRFGPHAPGILRTLHYKKEARGVSILSEPLNSVAYKLNEKIEKERDDFATIVKGVDELWDASIVETIFRLAWASAYYYNIPELGSRGLLDLDHVGIPRGVRYEIEMLFKKVEKGEADPSELKVELDRWHVWDEYQDRFFALFRRR
ncbi:MAG: hypothetical protein QMD14_02860 [Candidatus Aenigmarchaeota archaeon]|nr:hypothetical protein [Candidatus Aenigmarchaeota archaeon]